MFMVAFGPPLKEPQDRVPTHAQINDCRLQPKERLKLKSSHQPNESQSKPGTKRARRSSFTSLSLPAVVLSVAPMSLKDTIWSNNKLYQLFTCPGEL